MSRRARPPPILKSSMMQPSNPFAVCPRVYSPHVHFPPTPGMTSVHTTHSSHTYDRTPLTIAQNPCALPDRGERYYDNDDSSIPRESHLRGSSKGSYFHPRAYEVCEREKFDSLSSNSLPLPLMHPSSLSMASEADEADGSDFMTPSDIFLASPHTHEVDVRLLVVSRPSVMRKNSQETLDKVATMSSYASELSFTEQGRNQQSDSAFPSGQTSSPRRRSSSKFNSKFNGYSAFSSPSLDGCLGGF